ncbi:MAG: hypothetical protein ACRDF8_02090 [Chloroflexota bacterium]
MIRDAEGVYRCSHCGHELIIDRNLRLEAGLIAADFHGCSSSAAGMTVEETVAYMRRLELRWMTDQRSIRALQREAGLPVSLPLPPRRYEPIPA